MNDSSFATAPWNPCAGRAQCFARLNVGGCLAEAEMWHQRRRGNRSALYRNATAPAWPVSRPCASRSVQSTKAGCWRGDTLEPAEQSS